MQITLFNLDTGNVEDNDQEEEEKEEVIPHSD
jgi:hypothetical protein